MQKLERAVILNRTVYDRRDITKFSQIDVIREANSAKVRIINNKEFDGILVLSDPWKSKDDICHKICPGLAGTLFAYARPDEKLGSVINYTSPSNNMTYTFEVPVEFRKERNGILAINHKILAGGTPLIIPKKNGKNGIFYEITDMHEIGFIPNFPKKNAFYVADEKFGIPAGNREVSPGDKGARYLHRADNYVGLGVRGFFLFNFNGRFGVRLDLPPDLCFAAVTSIENSTTEQVNNESRM
ncbi:MAG: hypothetical protein NTX79_01870 [Candidatus Micrarchaeota archaeon]|nr:hypothetical protein [Candidatus Micrarchaeota archaeon]